MDKNGQDGQSIPRQAAVPSSENKLDNIGAQALNLSKATDRELVVLAKDNNQKAFEELMNRHYRTAYFMILKLLQNNQVAAEDLTIEAFAKAFNKLHLYKPEMARFNTWFISIVINHTTDYLRKRRLKLTSLDKDLEMEDGSLLSNNVTSLAPNPEELVLRKEKGKEVRLAIAKLPKLYREIVRLRYFEDKSYSEIQKELNLSVNTLKTRMHRAKKLLTIIIEEQP